MGGALVGAWLGFNAAADLLALITALVGAAVGANLALILFDISQARRIDMPVEPVQVVRIPERVDV
jgi:hypothetical protein